MSRINSGGINAMVAALGAALSAQVVAQPCAGWLPGQGGQGLNGQAQASVVWDPDGAGPLLPRLIMGGVFTQAGGLPASRVASWDGVSWSALGAGVGHTSGFAVAPVFALAVFQQDLIVGGAFNLAGGSPASRIARWNGSTWSTLGAGISGVGAFSVHALAVYNGDLIVGGDFTLAGGAPASRIARWNGSAWSPLGAGVNSTVLALVVHGSDLIVGGGFTTAGGVPAASLARWNGSAWSAMGAGVPGPVYSLAIRGDDLFAGGVFRLPSGGGEGIARWNGSAWVSVGGGLFEVDTATVYYMTHFNTELVVTGFIETAGGVPVPNIARWNGVSWRPLGGSAPAYNQSLAVFQGDLYVGGNARWRNALGDADNDNAVTFADLTIILNGFGATGAPGAVAGDVNNNGRVNFDDLSAALAAFGSVCAGP